MSYIHTNTYAYVLTYTHMYTYINTHKHTYIQTHTLSISVVDLHGLLKYIFHRPSTVYILTRVRTNGRSDLPSSATACATS